MGLKSGQKTNRSDAGMQREGDAIADLNGEKQDLRNRLLSDGKSYEEEYSHDYDVKSGDMGGMHQFKTSPRYVYPHSIEQSNPTLKPDFVKNLKNSETPGIREDDEKDDDEPNTPKRKDSSKIHENRKELTQDQEWKINKQSHPCLVLCMLFISMIIISVLTFYAKIMMHYEKQNAFESIYAINLINLILFAIVLKCKGSINKKRTMDQNLTPLELTTMKEEFNVFAVAKEDRLQFVFISVNLLLGVTFFYHALSWVDIRQFALVSLIVIGGVVPVVMNIKVQMWMKNECKIPNYIDPPSREKMIVNFVNLVLVIIGFLIIIYSFGKDLDRPDI